MHATKRRLITFFLAALLMLSFPTAASANSPPPSPWYTFVMTNLPEGTVYVDLLIRMQDTDPMYVDLVTENVPENFADNAGILSYCVDDYRSYTFHYRGARSEIRLTKEGTVTFFADSTLIYEYESTGHEEEVEKRGKICLAMLDGEGNILQVSKPHSLQPKGLLATSTGLFRYNASADSLTVESRTHGLILFLFIGVMGMVLTCAVECFVALFFDLICKRTGLILITNLISQLVMRIGQILLLWLLFTWERSAAHFWIVLLLEIPVYACEFLVYKKYIREASWQRCLAYTVCANTASVLAGLLMLHFVI